MSDWIAKVREKWTVMKKTNPSTTWKQAMVACKGNQNGATAPKSQPNKRATAPKKKVAENAYHKNLMSESEGESDSSSDDSF